MSKRFKIGQLYHWGNPKGGGQRYWIVGMNRHFLFLKYGDSLDKPEEVFAISKKAAEEHRFRSKVEL